MTNLSAEAERLIERARQTLQNLPAHTQTHTPSKRKDGRVKMTTPTTQQTQPADTLAASVSALYTSGKSIVEVATALGITYGKARKLLAAAGTPLRDPSERLKGRTRPVKETTVA